MDSHSIRDTIINELALVSFHVNQENQITSLTSLDIVFFL